MLLGSYVLWLYMYLQKLHIFLGTVGLKTLKEEETNIFPFSNYVLNLSFKRTSFSELNMKDRILWQIVKFLPKSVFKVKSYCSASTNTNSPTLDTTTDPYLLLQWETKACHVMLVYSTSKLGGKPEALEERNRTTSIDWPVKSVWRKGLIIKALKTLVWHLSREPIKEMSSLKK